MVTSSQAPVLRSLLATKDDKLYRLQDIGTARSWDYSLPTVSCGDFTDRFNFTSDRSFFGILKKSVNNGLPYRILEDAGVFERGNDLVLFGGCLLDIVFKRQYQIKDFDVRLVGEDCTTDDACVAKAKAFVASIFSSLQTENGKIDEQCAAAKKEGRDVHSNTCDLQDVTVSRSRSTVSVHVPDFGDGYRACVFQLTFSPAKSVRALLASCHPQCTRLAIKDGEVVLDRMARYCIESACIIVDPADFTNLYCGEAGDDGEQARRVTSGCTLAGHMSRRYIRYYTDKGFDLVLPDLDMRKVPRRNLEYDVVEVLALPIMTVVFSAIKKNQIVATQLSLAKDLESRVSASGLEGGYDASPAPNVGEAVHYNIRCLVNEVYDSFRYVSKGERWGEVFDFVPSLTPRMVRNSYETVMKDLEGGSVPIDRLTGYFSVTPPEVVVDKLVTQPLLNGICQKGRLPKSFSFEQDELKQLAQKETMALIDRIESLRKSLTGKGLDRLVVPFPENVSSTEEVFDAIYGSSGLK